MTTKNRIGNWADDPCFYVTVIDAKRVGLLAGPFTTKEDAESHVEEVRSLASKRDPWSHFYAFGVSLWPNGHRAALFGDFSPLAVQS